MAVLLPGTWANHVFYVYTIASEGGVYLRGQGLREYQESSGDGVYSSDCLSAL